VPGGPHCAAGAIVPCLDDIARGAVPSLAAKGLTDRRASSAGADASRSESFASRMYHHVSSSGAKALVERSAPCARPPHPDGASLVNTF
jgi:hypothetical protein